MPATLTGRFPIDESSSKLPKFNSLTGRYRFLHIPYSIHSVRNVCQQRIAQIIENIEGAENSEDDIIIWGETQMMKISIGKKWTF